MRKIFVVLSLSWATGIYAQSVNDYFESIRDNAAALTAFFSQMPKGGDLHHHFSGSVYAETYIDIAIEKDFFINLHTLEIREKQPVDGRGWSNFSTLQKEGLLFDYKQKLLRKWSAKDYNETDYPSHRQFFESFNHFSPAADLSLESGLLEIKRRAKAENVAYIETMLKTIPCDKSVNDLSFLNERLRNYQRRQQYEETGRLLDSVYNVIRQRNAVDCAVKFNKEFPEKLHSSLALDDSSFILRYQCYVIRTQEPVTLFRNLIVAFEAAGRSPLVVGVNIVAPEHYDVSMQDYWLHMQLFSYCHKKYPGVKYSMHAGELSLGLVRPEDMTWHINAAVREAKAGRIGHGSDMAYEKDCYALLNHMRKNDIPVEINLYSNEFILKIKEDRHPIMLYKKFNVPIVISTDDEGVLRTNLIEQYVLLAKRYKEIKYADIKQFVYNSITYSFIKEPGIKKKIISRLDADFANFEKMILAGPAKSITK